MPVFDSAKGDIPWNSLPNTFGVQFGGASSPASMAGDGNIYRNPIAVASGVNPGGTAGDYVVDFFAIPAGSLDKVGRGLEIIAMGNVASNTNSKRVKLWWNTAAPTVGSVVSGGTLIADTGAYTTTGAAGYSLTAMVFKTAAANSQICLHQASQIGAAVGALVAGSTTTATESGVIYVAVTANAATTATDITHLFTEVFAMN